MSELFRWAREGVHLESVPFWNILEFIILEFIILELEYIVIYNLDHHGWRSVAVRGFDPN